MRALAMPKKRKKKKPYCPPKITDFGTIESITKGNLSGTQDGDFSGSGWV
jgi:hypothetical protein